MPPAIRRRCFQAALMSDQLQPPQAGMAVPADDDVVMKGNAKGFRGFLDRPGHVDIGARGGGVA